MVVTIKQIAELSGVSRGTVDRVLNGRGNVRPEVAQRVLDMAQKLDYRPNRIGKALVAHAKKPICIGIVVNGDGNSFFDDVLVGARAAGDEIRDFNVKILVESTEGYDVRKQICALDKMESACVDGIAIAPINSPLIATRLNMLIDKGVDVVTFNSDIAGTGRMCFVGCDYIKSGRTAAGLMGKLLREPSQVAIMTGSLKMLGHNQRVDGFCRCTAENYKHIEVTAVMENLDNNKISYELMRSLLKENPKLSGVYFAAAGVEGGTRAIVEWGSPLNIVACDDTPEIRRLIGEGIIGATVCQQPFEQGYRPVKLIFDKIIAGIYPGNEFYYTDIQIKIMENI